MMNALVSSNKFVIGFIALFLALNIASGAALGAKWIVDDDGGPGVDFTDISSAIAAAAPGDIIVVRNGTYKGFTLEKGLTLLSDTGCIPIINSKIVIRDIQGGHSVVFSGFNTKRIEISHCTEPILVDDCSIRHPGLLPLPNPLSLVVDECDQLTITRSLIEDLHPTNGQTAAWFQDSTVIVSECTFIGGKGADGDEMNGEMGGSGLYAHSCTLFFQHSSAYGGNGGDNYGFWGIGGNGGTGISVYYSHLELFGLETDIIHGGAGGDSETGSPGLDASAVNAWESNVVYSRISFEVEPGTDIFGTWVTHPSTISEITPAVPVIQLNGTGQLGDFIEPILHGPAGAAYRMFYSPFQMVITPPSMVTQLLLDPRYLYLLAAGTIPAGSPPSHSVTIPVIPELQGIPVHLQAYLVTTELIPYLSTSASFVIK